MQSRARNITKRDDKFASKFSFCIRHCDFAIQKYINYKLITWNFNRKEYYKTYSWYFMSWNLYNELLIIFLPEANIVRPQAPRSIARLFVYASTHAVHREGVITYITHPSYVEAECGKRNDREERLVVSAKKKFYYSLCFHLIYFTLAF